MAGCVNHLECVRPYRHNLAIRKVFGPLGVLQRCQVHKRRNILDHLPLEHVTIAERLKNDGGYAGTPKITTVKTTTAGSKPSK